MSYKGYAARIEFDARPAASAAAPAPRNLSPAPYVFLTDTSIRIG